MSSILDSDSRLFYKEDSSQHINITKSVPGKARFIKILVVSYIASNYSCSQCVGHKYNTEHGCPVCGGSLSVGSTLECKLCGSVIYTCGYGNVNIICITVNAIMGAMQDEDVI